MKDKDEEAMIYLRRITQALEQIASALVDDGVVIRK